MKTLIRTCLILIFGTSMIHADFFPQFGEKTENTTSNRTAYAKELKTRVDDILNSMPSLSPNENQWIETELNKYKRTQNYEIYRALEGHIEFNIYMTQKYFKNYKQYLNDIINSKSTKEEMYHWAWLVNLINGSPEEWKIHIYKLYTNKEISENLVVADTPWDKDYLWDREMFYVNNCAIMSNQILRRIIIPYLKS